MGPNIVVFNDVTIKPPYKVENIGGAPESRQLKYVKKIVEKFTSDQAAAGTTSSAAANTSSSSPGALSSPTPATSNITAN
jgi:hypothetical protein